MPWTDLAYAAWVFLLFSWVRSGVKTKELPSKKDPDKDDRCAALDAINLRCKGACSKLCMDRLCPTCCNKLHKGRCLKISVGE